MTVYDRKNRKDRGFLFFIYRDEKTKNSVLRKIYKGFEKPGFSGFPVLSLLVMEKEIVAAILRHLKARPRCFAWKTHGGMYGTAGIPDIIACMDGRFYAFEVKQPGGRLTRLQAVTLEKMEAAGGVAVMVTSVDEVKALLAEKGAAI